MLASQKKAGNQRKSVLINSLKMSFLFLTSTLVAKNMSKIGRKTNLTPGIQMINQGIREKK